MPNIKSAKKRVLTNTKERTENRKVKGIMKATVKDAETNKDEQSLKNAYKSIDKALKKGVIKKNKATRQKSRLAKKISQNK
ncbi:MAG: 30S ribosomal protein S20 [Bacilli bacterium]|jgi:small subunit ribosomal protein S20|nr:30S ribosomal protein S20 [Bacilli bacterium]